ncbi:MAG: hypothetical protein ACKOQ4_04365 [Mycobacterium sp.]
MTAPLRRVVLLTGGVVLTWAGILAGMSADPGDASARDLVNPLAPGDPAPPTDTASPSFAPNPVDCTDPNNVINCQSPPIDSPLVQGTAPPGSPYRD